MVTQLQNPIDTSQSSESITKESIGGTGTTSPDTFNEPSSITETVGKGPNKAISDTPPSSDKFLFDSLGRAFTKPYAYLYTDMDIRLATTIPLSTNDIFPPLPANMSFNTGRAVL